MRIKSKEAVSPVIGVILMIAITVVLAAIVYLWVTGFFAGKGVAPNVSFTSVKTGTDTNEHYIVLVIAPSRNDITISAVRVKVINAQGAVILDKSLSAIYGVTRVAGSVDAIFNDDGNYLLGAGDSFYLYTTTYQEADKLVLVYVPSGSTMGDVSLAG